MAATQHDSITEYLSNLTRPLRPILTSLNGDNSWLMSFPRPEAEQSSTGKVFYHVAFEPWLKGPADVISSWLVHIKMVENPGVPTFESLENVIREIEQAAAVRLPPFDEGGATQLSSDSPLDAILLGFYYSDHLHPPTLKSFPPEIPVITTPPGAEIIETWNHFKTIRIINSLDASATSWQTPDLHPGEPFPKWLTPVFLPGGNVLNFVFAIIWSHTVDGQEFHEAILDSPHGVNLEEKTLNAFLESEPKTRKLAMLHGLKESHTAGSMTTYGAKGGLGLHRKVGGVDYWVVSHSAHMAYSGFIMRALWTVDTHRSIEWALEEEQKNDPSSAKYERPNVVKVLNGGSKVLTC
ncbi:uncharacterized protein B0J16DRAFT_348960 [Fusarium flagelliforme]|uniref:Uncharacterized protein n=1 Tax=Fusarium flagelliforme TaxID=2675880 RepID=A0A395M8F6_9HYPO|nr:uncharacterized protein B0J16DRAFT_348960 [Fusarium flagelliforme]KAH7174683.1 hypothetical protein B0J16DRAFT_348960 [Fusarium flagelliforme]RFN44197.1 hypothetical protein FIE12Z_11589 [Fusarium flagelliforme]